MSKKLILSERQLLRIIKKIIVEADKRISLDPKSLEYTLLSNHLEIENLMKQYSDVYKTIHANPSEKEKAYSVTKNKNIVQNILFYGFSTEDLKKIVNLIGEYLVFCRVHKRLMNEKSSSYESTEKLYEFLGKFYPTKITDIINTYKNNKPNKEFQNRFGSNLGEAINKMEIIKKELDKIYK